MTAGLSAIPYYIYSYILYRKNSDKNDVTGREDTYIVQENEQHAKISRYSYIIANFALRTKPRRQIYARIQVVK